MICGENFNVMNQPDILSGRVKPRVGRVGLRLNPSAPLLTVTCHRGEKNRGHRHRLTVTVTVTKNFIRGDGDGETKKFSR